MHPVRFLTSKIFRPLLLLTLAGVVLSQGGFGKSGPKAYPEEGKIVGTGVNQVTVTRTYKVTTDTMSYELDCGKRPPIFSRTPGECGGDKKLQIGDVIHFRLEKGKAYIPVPESVESGGEQKLRVLREELRPSVPAKKPSGN